MAYHVTGALNALFFAVALVGIGHQWWVVRRRRRSGVASASGVLSLNQLGVSFFAYWAFFLYGYWVEPFNPYLVWPRLAGAALVWVVLGEIAADRRDPTSRAAFGAGAALLAAGLAGLVAGLQVPERWLAFPQLLSGGVATLVLQGFVHQILEIRRHGHRGAVSTWMHVGTLVKDVSLLAFGVAMGQRTGWPLVLMASVSIVPKLVLLWHLRTRPRRAIGQEAA